MCSAKVCCDQEWPESYTYCPDCGCGLYWGEGSRYPPDPPTGDGQYAQISRRMSEMVEKQMLEHGQPISTFLRFLKRKDMT